MSKTQTPSNWFEVDKQGLANLVQRKGKGWVLLELIQNGWDTSARNVTVTLAPDGRGRALVSVTDDDPDGFKFLHHAYTLFAPSTKGDNPELRGRFNLGEKLFLAMAEWAKLYTTKGTVVFDRSGRNIDLKQKRPHGTCLEARLFMSADEIREAQALARKLIPPAGVTTTVNGETIPERTPIQEIEATLDTEWADAEGRLKRSRRKTKVLLYEPLDGEVGTIYEMGMPVVATRDRWHYLVNQRIPLNFERDNVTPGYLRDLRAAVLNATTEIMDPEIASQNWVMDALHSRRTTPEAVVGVVTARFGTDAVVTDMHDREANYKAVSQGLVVVHPRSFDKEVWGRIREVRDEFDPNFLRPAGQVTPGDKILEGLIANQQPVELADDVEVVTRYAAMVGEKLLGFTPAVKVVRTDDLGYLACYGSGQITFNMSVLGKAWFSLSNQAEIDALLLHEFAHERISNHLSSDWANEVARLGGLMRKFTLNGEIPSLRDFAMGVSIVPAASSEVAFLS
jgi:hypothetical protein